MQQISNVADAWCPEHDALLASLINASSGMANVSVMRMCMQRLRETGGNVPGDLTQVIPASRAEFTALARRVGIPRIQANTLAMRWLGKPTELERDPVTGALPTSLYRWYDAHDILLYIGISDRLRARTADHAEASSWMDFAVRSMIKRFPSRAEAEAAEEAAIKAEHPLFNHQHNDTPEARRALVEYLISHGRLDLLAPAVSRG